MIGTTFANFTVLEKINRAGMADIYLVTDKLDQQVWLHQRAPFDEGRRGAPVWSTPA